MLKTGVASLSFAILLQFVMLCAGFSYAQEDADSVEVEPGWKETLLWPFRNVVQPALNGLIYPVAKPVDYAVKNGVIDKTVELISFGEDYKIMIYPSFNFKPGSETMIGANYRHRSIFLEKDYLVFQGEYYANGDMGLTARYNKHSLFGSRFFGGVRYDIDFDRDYSVIIPETRQKYLQPDSSFSIMGRLGAPMFSDTKWNAELWASLSFVFWKLKLLLKEFVRVPPMLTTLC